MKKKTKKVGIGIAMEPELIEYLDGLRGSDNLLYRRRPRAQIVSVIIEQHAIQGGFDPFARRADAETEEL